MAGQRFSVDKKEYVLGGPLGDGAVGLVRRASLVDGGQELAVKFLAPDPKCLEESIFDDVASRFRREGERGAFLNHPHLLKIYSHCENKEGSAFEYNEPQNPFLLMEQIKGKTLESFIKKHTSGDRKGFTISRRRLNIAIQIADALSEIHRMRLIHRDVKPANIFLTSKITGDTIPVVKLGDFGIVKWGDFHSSLSTGVLTATNQKGLGTMKYMAPEQALTPKDVTTKADIFSFGATLFELFSAQILASHYHVFEIITTRQSRGTTISRYLSMRHKLREHDERIAEIVLEMMLRGVSRRPSIAKIQGNMESEYERRYGIDWESDLLGSQDYARDSGAWDED